MKRIPVFLIAFALFAACLASDYSDRRPPWDATLLASFNMGDGTDKSWGIRTPTVSAGATFPSGYRTSDYNGGSTAVISWPDDVVFESFPLTCMAWVRIDAYTSYRQIIGKMTQTGTQATYTGWHLYYGPGVSRGLAFGWAEETFTKYRGYYTASATLAAGAWYHVAATVASFSATPVLYINGAAPSLTNASGAGTIATIANSEPVRVGGKGGQDFTAYHDGGLDDARIYSRVLSLEEIAAIYAEGLGVSRP